MNIELKPGERLDDLQRNGYKIIQDPGRFCFGMDAVLLSGFAKVKPGERVVDLGTGTGIIPILLEARSKGASFTGLEIQPESADMASRSVQLNDLQERVHIVNGDIKEAVQIFAVYDSTAWITESRSAEGYRKTRGIVYAGGCDIPGCRTSDAGRPVLYGASTISPGRDYDGLMCPWSGTQADAAGLPVCGS